MDSFRSFLMASFAWKAAVGLITFTFLYIGLVVYRLFFSPLASFPGPWTAAASSWYEFYYDFWCQGKFVFQIEKLHQKYGPIVRINPDELSIHDPAFYNDIYVTESTRRTEAYRAFGMGLEFDGAHVLTVPHDLHRRRRKPLEPFFSRLGLSYLEDMIISTAQKLAGRLEELQGTDSIVRLDHAFASYSGDVIGRMCWEGRKEFLDDPDFSPEWYSTFHTIARAVPFLTGFPFLLKILTKIPESIIAWVYPSTNDFKGYATLAKKHILAAKTQKLNDEAKGTHSAIDISLFRYIMNSDMPESERSDDRLVNEAQILLGAGTVTTGRTLSFVSYYILANSAIRKRLEDELSSLMADYPEKMPSWVELEEVSYLTAIIKEGLRLSYGIMHRLPRCSPDVPIQYKQWTIPTGVPISMSAYLMHTDPEVYRNPFTFRPERWLGDIDPLMNRNFVPFTRGSRNCLGINLAYAELYIALAILFRPKGLNFELFQTDESDAVIAHDFIINLPKLDSKGIRILL